MFRNYNQNESIESKIRNALGLEEKSNYIIKKSDNTYTIKPITEKEGLHINTVKSIYNYGNRRVHLFQFCDIVFEHCIFECELKLQEITIGNEITFKNCTFQKPIYFINPTLDKDIVFQDITL